MEITINDIQNFRKSWANNVIASNLLELLSLYSSEAILKPTLSATLRNSTDDIKEYFEGTPKGSGFLHKGINKIDYIGDKEILKGNVATILGHYHFHTNKNETIEADYTFVLEKTDAGVKILSHHSSLTFK